MTRSRSRSRLRPSPPDDRRHWATVASVGAHEPVLAGAAPSATAISPTATVRRVTIGADGTADRLDKALSSALAEALSRSRLKALIEAGLVSSGGRTIEDPSARVKPGQSFDIILPDPAPAEPEPQPLPLVIVFEDEALLVVDKPAGLVVHPAAGNRDHTLVNALLAHCGDRLSGIGGVIRPGIVHRLDKDTSGLMVIAKTDAAHAALAAQFADRSLSRTYLAVIRGTLQPPEGVVDAPIGRSPVDRKKMAVVSRGGKSALTRYRTVRLFGNRSGSGASGTAASLVECTLATGRTHQIRVHLAHLGHPVLGDPLYGGKGGGGRGGGAADRDLLPRFPRQALHAARLTFFHPIRREELRFESDLPSDIKELIQTLESP